MKPLKIIFAGTPDFAARHLQALLDSEHQVIAVYTRVDKPAGRGHKLTPSPVKRWRWNTIFPSINPSRCATKKPSRSWQLLEPISWWWSPMADPAIGSVAGSPPGMHQCSRLYSAALARCGAIQRALWAGDKETGVTIMQMDVGLDTGDMLLKTSLPIADDDTSATLYEKLAQQGPVALIQALQGLAEGKLTAEPQDESLANYAEKLSKEEARIDWHKAARNLWQEIRAFNPWPVSYFECQGQNIKVWQAEVEESAEQFEPGTVVRADKRGLAIATADGLLVLKKAQLPGKKPLDIADILNARGEWFQPGNNLAQAS